MEMKSDVTRLPGELVKMPSVSIQLKMDEISTISKLAKGIAPPPVSQSVITQAPPSVPPVPVVKAPKAKSPKPIKKEVVVSTSRQNTAPQVQLPPGQNVVQTPEGLVVYSVASSTSGSQSVGVVQQAGSTPSTAAVSTAATYTIGVPATYLDGSNLYQLVPAASGQQVVYWPPVVGGGTSTATTATTVPASGGGIVSGSGGGVAQQLAVVQRGSQAVLQPVGSQAVLQPVQIGVDSSGNPVTKNSIITID